MRSLLALVGATLVASSSAGGGNSASVSSVARVRPMDVMARAAFDRGQRHSRTFARLVDELERSDVIVYVEVSIRVPPSIGGQLFFVTRGAAGDRFLRIRLNGRAAAFDMTATLGHELQHAVEVARSAGVGDGPRLAGLYRAVGIEVEPGVFESHAARDVEARVRAELFRPDVAVTVPCGWTSPNPRGTRR